MMILHRHKEISLLRIASIFLRRVLKQHDYSSKLYYDMINVNKTGTQRPNHLKYIYILF